MGDALWEFQLSAEVQSHLPVRFCGEHGWFHLSWWWLLARFEEADGTFPRVVHGHGAIDSDHRPGVLDSC